MSLFAVCSFAAWAALVAGSVAFRSRSFGAFMFVLGGIHTVTSIGLFPLLEPIWPVVLWLQAAVYLHFASLIRARLRPPLWRWAVALPGQFFTAGTFLALPWALAVAVGFEPPLVWLPFGAALVGLYQSTTMKQEQVDVVLGGDPVPELQRLSLGGGGESRPLRLVQITDPHLGPFMPESRLRAICERAVEMAPDLILVTGDLMTMEGQAEVGPLARALEPLGALHGRVFACRGNHDLEAPEVVAAACKLAGVRLLIDDSVLVETPAGPVQILGMDHTWRQRRARLEQACAEHPRIPDALRLVLLHDPSAFVHLPEGEGDLVLSGHTHGGQVGLVRRGRGWTVVQGLFGIPDHGFWGRGRDRMYVHRGTGHYGFPLRVGVPAEESLLRVHRG